MLKGDRTMEFRDKPMQNLVRIKEKEICKNVQALLLDGETIVGAYKTVRDQAVFTSHRIFLVDMQGVTGTRQEIFVLPYARCCTLASRPQASATRSRPLS